MEYIIESSKPSPKEFALLRAKVGWGDTDLIMAEVSLDNSLFHISARIDNRLIGMGRVIGDGSLFFYVQDLVVDPEFHSKGIGTALMQRIELYLSKVAKKGATIGLLSAKGKEPFYTKYDYLKRTGSPLGCGMCKFL
ncbi:MAG: GNAT family N-acetyltransferase [Alteromonadales bacterium]|nr:GNAT family N-acetyltransferase [Alteromonadales bacterium]